MVFSWLADGGPTLNAGLELYNFWLTVKVATLIFISGCGSAILSALEGKLNLFIIC